MKTRKTKPSFEPNVFLAKVDVGRTISKHQDGQIVFSQEDQPGDARGNDRHHTFSRELFHEQVSAVGLHRLQRHRIGSPQLIVECRSA
jgi:hypothetical protein